MKLNNKYIDKTNTRNRYINEAIGFYNKLHKRKLLSKQLSKESKLVAEESVKVVTEFDLLNSPDSLLLNLNLCLNLNLNLCLN